MSERLREWYSGRRVLVTGHTGFKGSWLATWLRDAGSRVTGYALEPEAGRPSVFVLGSVSDGMDSVIGDVRDRDALSAAFERSRAEIVFHLAAQSLVRRSYAQPVETFATNVVGTANLLDVARAQSAVRAIVVVTSDKCYENLDVDRGYREDDAMGGHDPYSASKGCQELVAAAFRRSFFSASSASVATARAGNVIGGGDWSEDRLVADIMLAAAAGRRAAIRNPDSVRPWQHVLEPLRGYLMLGRALVDHGPTFAEAWNFGPALTDAVPVREVVSRMTAAWSRVATDVVRDAAGPHEARLLRLDNSKAAARLGWTPALSLGDTIDLTVDWYRAVYDNPASARAMLERQIRDYEQRVAAARRVA